MPVSKLLTLGACLSMAPLAIEACSAAQANVEDSSGEGRASASAAMASAGSREPMPKADAGPTPTARTDSGLDQTSAAVESTGDGRIELETDFPPGTQSLRVRGLAHVLGKPRDDARYIGKITRGTRVSWKRLVAPDEPGEDATRRRRKRCEAWVEIEPRGYLCKELLEPSEEPPKGDTQPVIRPGRVTPNAYFKINENETQVYESVEAVLAEEVDKELSTKVMVIGYGLEDIEGVAYRKTDHGLIEASRLSRLWPSKFEGQRLDDLAQVTWPFGWVFFERWSRAPYVRAEPNESANRVRRAALREVISVLGERDGFVRIGDSQWIEKKYVRLAVLHPPPERVVGAKQWIDVDLQEQVLVAYEGTTPVFATLVSTGAARHPTPPALYRVRAKAATTPMAGDPRVPNRYEVSGVPWAIRFAAGFYIHGAYWHDGFGGPRSHGCVNVSPRDAAFLYEWVVPATPVGWSEVEVPGGEGIFVRIRDAQTPHPPAFDYTKEEPWNFPPAEVSASPSPPD